MMVDDANVLDDDTIKETMDGCLSHKFRSHSHEFNKMCSPHSTFIFYLAAVFCDHPVDVICCLSSHFNFR